jgi:hypothetical protein
MTLTEFLTARFDEDEAAARALDWMPRWVMADDLPNAQPGVVDHIVRHDPARVLAEVDAKRQIVTEYERGLGRRRDHPGDPASAGALLALHAIAHLLALPYADHPDYDEVWRP